MQKRYTKRGCRLIKIIRQQPLFNSFHIKLIQQASLESGYYTNSCIPEQIYAS